MKKNDFTGCKNKHIKSQIPAEKAGKMTMSLHLMHCRLSFFRGDASCEADAVNPWYDGDKYDVPGDDGNRCGDDCLL